MTARDFDASTADASSIRLGPGGAQPVSRYLFDVRCNRDFDRDLILTFRVVDIGLAPGDTTATLSGETYGGTAALIGSDSVNVLPCCHPPRIPAS